MKAITVWAVLGRVGIAPGVVVRKAGFQSFREPGAEMGWIACGSQDVDVEKPVFIGVPSRSPPSLLRNFGAAAFARPRRAEP